MWVYHKGRIIFGRDFMSMQVMDYKEREFKPRSLVIYFLIVFGLQALNYALQITGVLKRPAEEGLGAFSAGPLMIIMVLAAWGPFIGAFVSAAITEGKAGIKSLWKRFWNRNLTIKWLLVTLLILEAGRVVSALISRQLLGTSEPLFFIPDSVTILISPIFAALMTGITEEFGWRGFVLPRFEAKWNALVSSLILGVLSIAWHVGQWFVPGSSLYGRDFLQWGLGILSLSILMTWIFNNTKGSILAAILLHAMYNFSLVRFSIDWLSYGVLALMAVIVVLVFGPKKLSKQKAEAKD
jgi:membrane protease YdiL (CAAX protease family)